MAYGTLAYNKASFKASHNSYDRDENIHVQLAWDAAKPWQSGCRGLEFDIWRHSDSSKGASLGYFTVDHTTNGGPPLASYLGYLLSFHANHPGHDPILVMIDIKSSNGNRKRFPEEIDRYLGEWFDASLIYRPADLHQNPQASLLVNVERYGWPTIDALKGRFIFCLTGTESWKGYYADTTGPGSLCFADYEVDDDVKFEKLAPKLPANRVFLNMHVFSSDYGKWKVSTQALSARGYFVRTYVLDSQGIWSKAMNASVNMLATDEVRAHKWAHVGAEPFVGI